LAFIEPVGFLWMDAILNLVAAESHKITEGIIHEKFALTFNKN